MSDIFGATAGTVKQRIYVSMRILQPLVLVLVVCCLAACDDPRSRLIWSPSGQRLAVLADDGLRIWSADKLSAPLIKEHVRAILWLPDSNKAIVATAKRFSSWQELLDTADPSQRQDILSTAEKWKAAILKSRGDDDKLKEDEADLQKLPEGPIAFVYLALHDRNELKDALGSKWHSYETLANAETESVIQHYDIERDKAIPGALIERKFGVVENMCLSPDGKYLLCAADAALSSSSDGYELSVTDTIGDTQEIIAKHAALNPDWTPDSLSIVYISKHGEANSEQALNLASVIKKQVRSSDGALLHNAVDGTPAKSNTDNTPACIALAGVPFSSSSRVRCLKNGSVLMSCGGLRLPALPNDPVHTNLFFLPAKGPIAPVITLADRETLGTTSYFELNPSKDLAAIETDDGIIYLLDLQTSTLTPIQDENKFTPAKAMEIMPSWKSDSELCFVAGAATKDIVKRAQVVLWSVTSGTSQKLSSDWPSGVLKQLQEELTVP